ncbi:hydroxyacylglutathione hydrolase, mitochondrial-like [Oppia nitens]|uniref:hydroxyacylglutathione hydrolase, mitochondrial-like n=1 Tax=Oppia nitens TaxID=1686743 RepID=UPI0023DADF72|nr:hydroxyacylglutathione hydrolase, mitochondrial-like [Oppia nitens]
MQFVLQKGFSLFLPFLRRKSFHSQPKFVKHLNNMRVNILPALGDNYMYLLIDEKTREAAIVDPVEPNKVLTAVKAENVNLTTVLTTHHHWDHAGGNEELVKLVPNLTVVGGDERVGALNKKVSTGDQLTIGQMNVECLFTPCHTKGHICYYVTSKDNPNDDPLVFTGDTLFVSGCGKFFEGTPQQMHRALIDVLANLPLNTRVYCGHEYTVTNLKFANSVEPNNEDIINKLKWAQEMRSRNEPTVPSTIADENKTNPFMRVNVQSVQKHVNKGNDVIATMEELRHLKNNFRAD